MNKSQTVKYLSSLTIRLLVSYEEKNTRLANERGLTEAEFKCLRLFGSDKGISNTKIAARMNLSPSRLTRIIDGLVEKGFMTRGDDRKDRRLLNITLSRKGKLFVHKLDKLNDALHNKILKEISVSQRKSVIVAMEKLYSATEKWLKKTK